MSSGVATEPPFRRGALWLTAADQRERRGIKATLIVIATIIGLGALGAMLVMRAFSGAFDDDGDNGRASRQVRRLANEQFPAWRATHPDQLCPDRLSDLDDTVLDPWGRALQYTCDPRLLPAASPGIAITSAGEDGTFGTADDIGSDT